GLQARLRLWQDGGRPSDAANREPGPAGGRPRDDLQSARQPRPHELRGGSSPLLRHQGREGTADRRAACLSKAFRSMCQVRDYVGSPALLVISGSPAVLVMTRHGDSSSRMRGNVGSEASSPVAAVVCSRCRRYPRSADAGGLSRFPHGRLSTGWPPARAGSPELPPRLDRPAVWRPPGSPSPPSPSLLL